MVNFFKNFFSSLNTLTTQCFFYVVNSVDFILAFLNKSWVYCVFVAILFLIPLKILMGFLLLSHTVGKFVMIIGVLNLSWPYKDYIFRDFKINLFSWLELCGFMIFSIQVFIVLISTLYDARLYFLYHRHGLPCSYLGEFADQGVENFLFSILHFFGLL